MIALTDHNWPGNIRELENFMERSVILSNGSVLYVPLGELIQDEAGTSTNLEAAERAYIIKVLRECGGVIAGPNGAAGKLGLKRTTLQSKIQRLKISRSDYEGQSERTGS
jgi:DNA-binding NtrC family response regulator